MFTAVLFTTAKTWKQPKQPQTDEWIKVIYIHTHPHTQEYYSTIKRNDAICNNMDRPEIIILRKSHRERQILYDITCMWNLKKNYTNELIYKTERLIDLENKLMVTKGEKSKGKKSER